MLYRIAVLLLAASLVVVGIAAAERSYVAGRFALEIDGIAAGWMKSAEGGHATSDVVTEDIGGTLFAKKHIAGVKYEDFSINCGTGMSKGFYEWIKASFDHKPFRKNGAIHVADYDYKEMNTLAFSNALITEVGFPACDASSKDPAFMALKFAPEVTRFGQGSGKPLDPGAKIQKKWLPANFRLTIDGLDCTRVNKIEAITVKQSVVERLGQIEPTKLEYPNLVVTLPESSAKTFYDWHEDFVIKGNNSDASEKTGSLEYLTPDLKDVLFTLTFSNLGIFKCTPEKAEAGSENIRRVKAELYCEEMKFTYGSGATFGVK